MHQIGHVLQRGSVTKHVATGPSLFVKNLFLKTKLSLSITRSIKQDHVTLAWQAESCLVVALQPRPPPPPQPPSLFLFLANPGEEKNPAPAKSHSCRQVAADKVGRKNGWKAAGLIDWFAASGVAGRGLNLSAM